MPTVTLSRCPLLRVSWTPVNNEPLLVQQLTAAGDLMHFHRHSWNTDMKLDLCILESLCHSGQWMATHQDQVLLYIGSHSPKSSKLLNFLESALLSVSILTSTPAHPWQHFDLTRDERWPKLRHHIDACAKLYNPSLTCCRVLSLFNSPMFRASNSSKLSLKSWIQILIRLAMILPGQQANSDTRKCSFGNIPRWKA